MKMFYKVLFALVVLAILVPFAVLKNDAGKPLMSLSSFSLPDFSLPEAPLPEMRSLSSSKVPVEADDSDLSGKDVFYKWRDAEGNLHFTSEPPPEGVEYTLKGYDPDANVIQSVEPESVVIEAETEAATQASAQTREPGDIGNPYSQESIEKLFKDAKNIEKMLNERLQHFE